MIASSTFAGSAPETAPPTSAPRSTEAPSRRNSRQFTRPARMWAIEAAAAATPEMPMFAPAPAAGDAAHEHDDGQPDVPEHEPDETAHEGDHEAPHRKEHRLDVDRPMLEARPHSSRSTLRPRWHSDARDTPAPADRRASTTRSASTSWTTTIRTPRSAASTRPTSRGTRASPSARPAWPWQRDA